MNLFELTRTEIDYLWQLYVLDCEQTGTHPDFSDFSLWYEEQYGDDPND
jgi:hypothetical protein